jgi:protein FRA10AC1
LCSKAFSFFLNLSNRCAEKLHYKRRKEKELEEKREQEENKRKRCQPNAIVVFTLEPICTVKVPVAYSVYSRNRSRRDDETDIEYEEAKERRKGLDLPLIILQCYI